MQTLNEYLVEHCLRLDRVHHVGGLVHAELLGDDFELGLQHLADAVLHRVFENEVDGPHHMALADTVHAANALFDAHRVPRHVEVDDHVAKLKVQALAASVGRDQNPNVLREDLLRLGAGIQVHAAVEQSHREATAFQEAREHGLCRHELREDQDLHGRIVLFLLQLVDQLQQGLSLCVGALGLGFPGQGQQEVNLGLLLHPARGLHRNVHLALTVQLGPLVHLGRIEQ